MMVGDDINNTKSSYTIVASPVNGSDQQRDLQIELIKKDLMVYELDIEKRENEIKELEIEKREKELKELEIEKELEIKTGAKEAMEIEKAKFWETFHRKVGDADSANEFDWIELVTYFNTMAPILGIHIHADYDKKILENGKN